MPSPGTEAAGSEDYMFSDAGTTMEECMTAGKAGTGFIRRETGCVQECGGGAILQNEKR
jgi:hypothetical protein